MYTNRKHILVSRCYSNKSTPWQTTAEPIGKKPSRILPHFFWILSFIAAPLYVFFSHATAHVEGKTVPAKLRPKIPNEKAGNIVAFPTHIHRQSFLYGKIPPGSSVFWNTQKIPISASGIVHWQLPEQAPETLVLDIYRPNRPVLIWKISITNP